VRVKKNREGCSGNRISNLLRNIREFISIQATEHYCPGAVGKRLVRNLKVLDSSTSERFFRIIT
jgi:hypothetical protein